jgi:light-regulated signal transduction histidine kinase (bacteriophytochrome)
MPDPHVDNAKEDADSSAPDTPEDTVPPLVSSLASASRSQNLPSSETHGPRRPAPRSSSSTIDNSLLMNPDGTDRVFPMRSVVSVDPSSTPAVKLDRQDGYFHGVPMSTSERKSRARPVGNTGGESSTTESTRDLAQPYHGPSRNYPPRLPPEAFTQMVTDAHEADSVHESASVRSGKSGPRGDDVENEYTTTRFAHVVTEDGHAIITGRDGEDLQRCEDEPIHIPGAIQSYGLIIALEEEDEKFIVRIVSENSENIIGYTPRQLFALETFTDILTEEQSDNLLDHIDFVREEETDVEQNGPELFTISIKHDNRRPIKLWCAIHIHDRHPDLIICEFELENDTVNPTIHPSEMTPDIPEDTLNSNPTMDEYIESTKNMSKPLRVLRSARKSRGEAAAMEVFNIMSQIQEQLASAPTLEFFLKILVGVVKELTGFHRVMIYQFDNSFNGRVVTELVDPRATKDLYKGLHFPASDIPKQARDLYKINRVRLLYDRDQETARLVCRTLQDLETPLDLTHSYLRAMSPIHLKYLKNMAVRSSMSISINAFNELWGLISCHSYGQKGMRVSFPIRKMCRLVGDTASRNIERLSYASRLQARKLINTVPTQRNPSGYIIASSEDLLSLFNADFGLLCIQDETKMLGEIESIQETLAMLEYLKFREITSVTTSQDIKEDFPDLIYRPGFQNLAGMLLVPLSPSGTDFIAFFRSGQLKEVKWAGNPYEKIIREGTHAYLEPRKSFKLWSETIVGKCREWTEEEVETAAVLCLVYGKFIEVWRQKEAALQNSQLTKLLLANSAHEVRTPLNAIINYLEIALGKFCFLFLFTFY